MHKIISLKRQTQKKDGTAYKTKKGIPFTMLYVKVEGQPKDVSFFEYADSPSKEWVEGQEYEFTIEQNGEYLNGKFPEKNPRNDSPLLEDIWKLTQKNTRMLEKIGRKLFEEELKGDYPESDGEPAF